MMDIPIVPVLEHYDVEVRNPNRAEVIVLCPVHEETHPSCSVNTVKNVLNCKSCGFAGDTLSLIMKKEGVDFAAALARAAEITGEVSEGVSRAARPVRVGIHGEPRAGGYKPKYRNTPPRVRPLSHPGG